VRELDIDDGPAPLAWPRTAQATSGERGMQPDRPDLSPDIAPEIARPPHEVELHALLETLGGAAGDRSAIGRRLLERGDLIALSRTSAEQLVCECGLRADDAARLAAAFELGRRVERARLPSRARIDNAAAVFNALRAEIRGLERETFFTLLLDGKHQLKRREVISIGSLTSSLVHPREVFRAAVATGAAAVVCAHNHPSGDPEPSAEDLDVTRRLAQAGRLLGIALLDHVILGDARYVSLRERLTW
jgi:DNA repair protein RadC